ncbi:hypothetical protein [Geodermatophilus marinus]|uniref:hypothetical protein n=1 Tax=Geodermatophilus sp. LHW52908 TaxID=2303986 RepID=UPI000E3D7420|nr:hypothetical protein [Geodermatophilus sp. LHW52908]RFU19156.1 hypothetical protein D0Z06_22795 [Geodermatophilus sp. LHW52908]
MAKTTGTPGAEPRRRLRQAVARSQRRTGVQLPIGFVRSLQSQPEATPLVRLLRGGRGGEIRLKLYLSLSLLATAAPYDIGQPIPSSWWAHALGLADPERGGARRVSDALDWLERNDFIRLGRRPGYPSSVTLLDARGGGGPYRSRVEAGESRWIVVPLGLWRQEWIVVLSGSALALFLVLIELTGGRTKPASLESGRHNQYGLSTDTWRRASKELSEVGLLSVGRITEGRDLDVRRTRNTYLLDLGRLDDPVSTPPSSTLPTS